MAHLQFKCLRAGFGLRVLNPPIHALRFNPAHLDGIGSIWIVVSSGAYTVHARGCRAATQQDCEQDETVSQISQSLHVFSSRSQDRSRSLKQRNR